VRLRGGGIRGLGGLSRRLRRWKFQLRDREVGQILGRRRSISGALARRRAQIGEAVQRPRLLSRCSTTKDNNAAEYSMNVCMLAYQDGRVAEGENNLF